MWLIDYFGYWLEVLLVVAARAMKGSLLVAMRTHRPQPTLQARAGLHWFLGLHSPSAHAC